MIKGWLIGFNEVIARLDGTHGAVLSALDKSVRSYAILLLRRVKENKLSGQVLQVRSGRLRRSVNQRVISSGSSVTAAVGTNVEYAAKHEHGFNGTEEVKAHLRTIKMVWGKRISPRQISVRQHSRQVNYQKHSFLRTALDEMMPDIQKGMKDAVVNAAVKGKA